jgi:rod shape-determining protein MreB
MGLRSGVAIDLGTVNTLISVAGRGVVVEEPSTVALDKTTGKVAAVGHAAAALAGKEPVDVEVIHPMREGVIADMEASTALLHAFLRRAGVRALPRPYAMVCVPTGATEVERRSIPTALGARSPYCRATLVDEPVAAAAGAGVDLAGGEGAFIVDLGGGTTDIALVAGGRVVRARSLRVGGNAMDQAIVNAAKAELGLVLGRRAARRLKITVGLTGGETGFAEAVGVDVVRRAPRVENVPGQMVAAALEEAVATIVNAVQEMLSDVPPDLAEDVVRGKIRLAGGGALLLGLASRIETLAGIPAMVVDDPLRCVVRGAAAILAHGGGIVGPRTPGRTDNSVVRRAGR